MPYEVKLIGAEIDHAMKGTMRVQLETENIPNAVIEYDWTEEFFNARFIGHAPSMPAPAHPTAFIFKPIEAIQKLKSSPDQLPTDVFKNHKINITID